jgi:hypothetical protein
MAGCYEYGNEPSGSIKGEIFFDHLSNCQLLKMYCVSCNVRWLLMQLNVVR